MNLIDPDKRAKELHKLLKPITQRQVTIAVGNTLENISLVGTSEDSMRKSIRENLEDHELVATPNANHHAEEDIVETTEKLDLHLTEIGTSRPICIDCEDLLKSKNIELKTECSGKKSKKRQ